MFYRSIHYLRAFAALSVVAYHAFPKDMAPVLTGGVDVFFVISGFVMVESTRRGFVASRFLAARAVRIFPAYWIACALTYLFVAKGPIQDWFFLSDIGTIMGWPVVLPFLLPGWTLVYELVFYMLFACCFGNWKAVTAVLMVLSASGAIWQTAMTNPVFVEFAFGMALANAPRDLLRRWAAPLFLAAMLGFMWASSALTITMAERWWLLGFPAAALVAAGLGYEKRVPESRVLHFLGSASYSIYLIHFLLMTWFKDWTGFFIGTAAGCLVYVLLEAPVTRLLKRVIVRLQRRSPAASPAE
ncbi:acyltransferase family protein [Halovulum sp. GXIMD14794]